MDNIFYTQNQNTKETKELKTTYYTILGHHDYIENDKPVTDNAEKSLAKTITKNGTTRYFVKIGQYGKLYNPIGMYSEGKDTKFLSKIGKNEFEFKQVNMRIFDLYVQFLTSRNIAWLNNAQRELV